MPVLKPIDRYTLGFKEGYKGGRFTTKQEFDAVALEKLGTTQLTTSDAIEEINANLATSLASKGIEISDAKTTADLSVKVNEIEDPVAARQEGYDVGLEQGKALEDAILDGTAFADGTYTNNTVKSLRATALNGASVKKLYMDNLETLQSDALRNSTITYVHFPKLKQVGTNAMSYSGITGDWSFLEGVESIQSQCFRACKLPETINLKELTSFAMIYAGSPFLETSVKHLQFPKLQSYGNRLLSNNNSSCVAVETLVCGSAGFPVTYIDGGAFYNGNLGSLTSITVYCEDPNNPPAGSPWGATNATVTFLKA